MEAEDFSTHYKAMEDEQLLSLALKYDELTDSAQTAMRAEFARRGLEPPLLEERPGSEVEPLKLVTVRRYRDLSEAIVARSLLESAGITVDLQDENLVRLDWQVSNMIGGIRLRVEAQDEAGATELLREAGPGSIEFAAGQDFVQPHCFVCGSSDITFEGASRSAAMTALYLLSVPLPTGAKTWVCNQCGTRWKDEETV
ncbi:putative signal transducing protein [Terriglobus saanensis]|uniref:Uncharacterized protein n=1 Tax=Terriglobus saanensis (strain ATCC BAA-1853 / DSM 23119 / SP1PR4) TaxID=401053 RepID=E8V4F8_TERSS|nr:DUF2007 domain-containing protein [Terriglobus saanensis]ADV84782.1 hypothetical protein AciPR4_4033 [Terriglobus saanensis SP1PR4]